MFSPIEVGRERPGRVNREGERMREGGANKEGTLGWEIEVVVKLRCDSLPIEAQNLE